MDRVDWFMVEHGDQEAWRQTQAVRPNHMDPAHNMAGMAAKAMGLEPPPQPHPAGIAVHYAVGMGPAALYSVARRHLPGGVMSRGLVLGLGMFLVEDEIINPLIGAAAPPHRYPWQAHARGLIAHLVLGVVTEAVLTAFDQYQRPNRTAQRQQGEPYRTRRNDPRASGVRTGGLVGDEDLPENSRRNLDQKLDHALEETFPTSDPVSVQITK
jgi:hypothetical protein